MSEERRQCLNRRWGEWDICILCTLQWCWLTGTRRDITIHQDNEILTTTLIPDMDNSTIPWTILAGSFPRQTLGIFWDKVYRSQGRRFFLSSPPRTACRQPPARWGRFQVSGGPPVNPKMMNLTKKYIKNEWKSEIFYYL